MEGPGLPERRPAPASPPPPPPLPRPVADASRAGGAGTRDSRWRGCLLVAVFLAVVLCALVGYSFHKLAGFLSAEASWLPAPTGRRLTEQVLNGSSGEARKIAVIDVKGIIVSGGWGRDAAPTSVVCGELKTAREDDDVVAVVLDMNTPGGEVTASDEIHQAVRKVRAAGKPVVTCMRSLGASGGYFVACGGDYIIANRLTITGSVGVIIGTLNYAELFELVGLRSDVFKSGDMKDLLNGGREPTEEERAFVQSLVDETFREFAVIVASGRDRYEDAEAVIAAPVGDGRILTGRQALEEGLIDGLGYFDDAVDKAKELAGVPDARVVRYRRPTRLADLLLSMRAEGGPVLSWLAPAELRFVQPGRFYYLMPTVVP